MRTRSRTGEPPAHCVGGRSRARCRTWGPTNLLDVLEETELSPQGPQDPHGLAPEPQVILKRRSRVFQKGNGKSLS